MWFCLVEAIIVKFVIYAPLSKQYRNHFSVSEHTTSSLLELVHCEPIPLLAHEKRVKLGWPTNWKRVTIYNPTRKWAGQWVSLPILNFFFSNLHLKAKIWVFYFALDADPDYKLRLEWGWTHFVAAPIWLGGTIESEALTKTCSGGQGFQYRRTTMRCGLHWRWGPRLSQGGGCTMRGLAVKGDSQWWKNYARQLEVVGFTSNGWRFGEEELGLMVSPLMGDNLGKKLVGGFRFWLRMRVSGCVVHSRWCGGCVFTRCGRPLVVMVWCERKLREIRDGKNNLSKPLCPKTKSKTCSFFHLIMGRGVGWCALTSRLTRRVHGLAG